MIETASLITDYPKDVKENLIYRRELYLAARNNKVLQSHLKAICAKDILVFVNLFMFTYDPRKAMKKVPFITYPFQDETLLWDKQCLIDNADQLVEKSRDMGASWMFIVSDIHDWIFSEQKIEILWGSRKEAYIDSRGDMKTIFEKFRFALANIPSWLLPVGFDSEKHDNNMRLINPATGSAIIGEATNPNFSRGGRFLRIRFDEYAFWDCAEEAWQAAADATNCRTALSTVNGSSNKFAQLANSKIRKKSLHWTLHPLKNVGAYLLQEGKKVPIFLGHDEKAAYKCWLEHKGLIAPEPVRGGVVRSDWYDAECARRDKDSEIAEELDIDYLRSGMPFFDLRSVARQARWTYFKRQNPSDPLPRGRHIRASLVDVDHKIELRETEFGWLRVFELPKRDGQYVVSADAAEGLEKQDEAFGVVRDKYTRNLVASFNGAIDPDDLAHKLKLVSEYYNKALIAPENNNHGYSVCSDLKQMDCNLYWTEKVGDDGKISRVKPGFTTTSTSRPLMLDQADEEIRKNACEVRDEVILDQMETFVRNVKKHGKPEADGQFLDDGVMAFAIGGQVIQEKPYKRKVDTSHLIKEMVRPNNAGFSFKRS